MKQTWCILLVLTLLSVAVGCSEELKGVDIFSDTYNFAESSNEWIPGFSDFPVGDSTSYQLKSAYTADPLTGQKALMITGNNISDDLFMFYKRRLKGFRPNTEYILTFEVELLTDLKAALTGSADESVYLKVGATAHEPKSLIDEGKYVMNIDKGNYSLGGRDMVMIGDVAASSTSTSDYTLISRSNTETYSTPCIVRTNSDGELWLIMGTDSGYQGVTTLYYTKVSIVFSASN
jgi:hypothetical protein